MREKFKFKNKRIFSLFLIILLNCCALNLDFLKINSRNEKNTFMFEKTNIRSSKLSERIIISNNWSDAKDVGICSGSGTFSDPYMIKDLVIDGGGSGTGILIGSKKVYFRIENCTIYNCESGIRLALSCNGTLLKNNCSYNDIGIYLDGWTDLTHWSWEQYLYFYCMNNTLTNNTINNNGQYGVYMRNSDNNSILGNNINQNEYGIYFDYYNDNNTIISNSLIKNKQHGIFSRSPNCGNVIKQNYMISCGFYFDEYTRYEPFLYNLIDSTNLVNNGHLYFYANSTDLDDEQFFNAGQIFLVNCSNSAISNLDLSDGSVSISLFDCENISILHNNLSSNSLYGIYADECNKITIKNNSINFNYEGLRLLYFNNSMVLYNTISKNLVYGICITFGYNNSFANNKFTRNSWGFRLGLYNNNNNTISRNIFKDNINYGIHMTTGNLFNLFYENFFMNNTIHAYDSNLNTKWNNSKIGNYWDDYNGIDADNDGIGDIPYNISDIPLIQDFLPIVDDDAPEITIISPSNNSVYGNSSPSFLIRVKEKFIDEMWYTLDNGIHNYTIKNNGTIDQTAWSALVEGAINLVFYAKDILGNTAFKEITIHKRISTQGPNLIIILSIIFGTIGIIAVGAIILLWKKFR